MALTATNVLTVTVTGTENSYSINKNFSVLASDAQVTGSQWKNDVLTIPGSTFDEIKITVGMSYMALLALKSNRRLELHKNTRTGEDLPARKIFCAEFTEDDAITSIWVENKEANEAVVEYALLAAE